MKVGEEGEAKEQKQGPVAARWRGIWELGFKMGGLYSGSFCPQVHLPVR